jgi:hypothetical protein
MKDALEAIAAYLKVTSHSPGEAGEIHEKPHKDRQRPGDIRTRHLPNKNRKLF